MDLHTSAEDGILHLKLNRPARLNALTTHLITQLLEAVRAGMADDSVRVLLLSGEGRAFCAGKDRDEPASMASVHALQALAQAMVMGNKPVLSAVQGWAVGGGFELMVNTDLSFAAPDARFVLPEIRLNLAGTGGIAALLPKLVGMQRAKALLMLGETIDAKTAQDWGLVYRVAEDPMAEALSAARQLTALDPAILGSVKALLHREHLDDFPGALQREVDLHQGIL